MGEGNGDVGVVAQVIAVTTLYIKITPVMATIAIGIFGGSPTA